MKKLTDHFLFKTIFTFIFYLCYTYIINSLLSMIGVSEPYSSFVADLIFLSTVIGIYIKDIKLDLKKMKTNLSLKKTIIIICSYFGLIILINIAGTIVNQILSLDVNIDDNTTSIWDLSNISIMYTLFKTLLFSSIAEELVFKKSVRDVIDNKLLFVIISSFIYAFMNIAYVDLSSPLLIIDILSYFALSALLSYNYVKYDNIILIIIIKLVYNLLVPVMIMFMVNA